MLSGLGGPCLDKHRHPTAQVDHEAYRRPHLEALQIGSNKSFPTRLIDRQSDSGSLILDRLSESGGGRLHHVTFKGRIGAGKRQTLAKQNFLSFLIRGPVPPVASGSSVPGARH